MLTPEDFSLLAGRLRPHTEYLYLHLMGEPLAHPQLEEILRRAGALGFRVMITTNGTLLEERGGLLLGAAALVQVLYGLLPFLLPFTRNFSGDVLTGVVPNLAVNEFGFEFIALGLAMYFLRDRREALAAVYLVFCIYQFSAEALYGVFPVQWMMVLALPLMLRYNGEKGRGWKWFFYAYYPAHTCLLFLLARGLG